MAGLQAEIYTINCVIVGENIAFPVKIASNETVGFLKDMIKEKKPNRFASVDADELTLRKLLTPISEKDANDMLVAGRKLLELPTVKMLPTDDLSDHFSKNPPRKTLHVTVEPPLPSAGQKHGLSNDDADGEPAAKRKKGPRHSGPESVVTSYEWCERQDTVSGVLELLHKERLVQVRGTPASGKTTLMQLLHALIVKKHPNARVTIHHAWPKKLLKEKTGRIAENLPGFPSFENGEQYFLFDEGQTTYWDDILWKILKDYFQSSSRPVYAILFCSYGNEGVSDAQDVTPVNFGAGRVTLDRTDKGLSKPCGLLLDQEEFHDVINRRGPKLFITDDLRDFIYQFTQGHVGAIIAVVTFLLKKREFSMLRGEEYCLEAFRQDTATYDEFCQHLSMDHGIARGVPPEPAEYAQAMRALLLHQSINPKPPSINPKANPKDNRDDIGDDIRSSLRDCYKRGYVNMNEDKLYTFASPLHQQLWSWILLPQADYQFPCPDLFSFVRDTVSKFRPSQLDGSDRRVRSASHRPPEAQYQEEYYRCVHKLTQGNVRISPEYAAAAGSRPGRIDFFIPSKKWGIELTRDGSKLAEHDSRFADNGAYGQWLQSSDMEDYILLDFRSTMPRAHPGINKLYFVVFNDDKTRVDIYDNNLNPQHSANLTHNG